MHFNGIALTTSVASLLTVVAGQYRNIGYIGPDRPQYVAPAPTYVIPAPTYFNGPPPRYNAPPPPRYGYDDGAQDYNRPSDYRRPGSPARGVYLCKDSRFRGDCYYQEAHRDECVNVAPGFNDAVNSATPAPGHVCYFYEDANCGGRQTEVTDSGEESFRRIGFGDIISSLRCERG
jgi:hypothetical protein